MPIIIPMSSAKKSIVISDIDSLKENTTYSFNFGESIEDNNEEILYRILSMSFQPENILIL